MGALVTYTTRTALTYGIQCYTDKESPLFISENNNPVIFGNTDSVFLSTIGIAMSPKDINKLHNKYVQDKLALDGMTERRIKFGLENENFMMYIPDNYKNRYLMLKQYDTSNIERFRQQYSIERYINDSVTNPNGFVFDFESFGQLKSKNFKQHLIPQFFQEHIRNLMFAMFIYKSIPTRIIRLFISKVMT